MGKLLAEAFPPARAVFDRADAALGVSISRICFEGPEEALRLTATTQPAILTVSIAALEALRARAGKALRAGVVCAAGHSLGEYSALVAAGALGLEDAVRAVRRRGEYMQEAVPVGGGAMAAVLGATLEQVKAICREAAHGEVLEPANLNAPDQTVISGAAAAVDRFAAMAKERGIRKVIRLPVSAPFHCALMGPAADRLAVDLGTLPLRDAAFPVIQNVSAEPETGAAAFRTGLRAQVVAPVRWVETIRRMKAMGVQAIVEVGPGRVLTGLAKRTDPTMTLLNVEDPASLEAAGAALAGIGGAT
jgi:[acyl-carrier-protein] S-malonyltransferase